MSSKTIDTVSYALDVSINGVTCVFQVIRYILMFVNWLNSSHQCVHQNLCDWQ